MGCIQPKVSIWALGFLILGVSLKTQVFQFSYKKASEVHSNLLVDISNGCRWSSASLARLHHCREWPSSMECLFLNGWSDRKIFTAHTDCSSWLTLGTLRSHPWLQWHALLSVSSTTWWTPKAGTGLAPRKHSTNIYWERKRRKKKKKRKGRKGKEGGKGGEGKGGEGRSEGKGGEGREAEGMKKGREAGRKDLAWY